jgi:hypothetical protein
MAKKRTIGFFSQIQSKDDALGMIRYISLGMFLLAGVLVVLAVINRSVVWIDALVYVGLALLLRQVEYSWTRGVALFLLVGSLGLLIVTLTQMPGLQAQGRNAVLATFMVISSIRAVEATFKLHGKYAGG